MGGYPVKRMRGKFKEVGCQTKTKHKWYFLMFLEL